MISTERKAQVIRNGILSRLRSAAEMEGEYNLTSEEADFLWANIKDIDAVIERIIATVDQGAARTAAEIDARPKLAGR